MTEIIDIKELKQFFKDRDNDHMLHGSLWSLSARVINGEVWYECWYKASDTLSSNHDYSSRDLKDVLDYCNSCVEDSFYYY